jgi:hypothetical protein
MGRRRGNGSLDAVSRLRWGLVVLLVPYVFWLIFAYRYHFLDGVNLLLHEAGHVVFLPFGQTAHFLGGTIGQLLFPAVFAAIFFKRGQRFEACIVGIWFAESLMYAAEYISDARAMVLPLVGGHIHDWNWLLARWGVLRQAETIGGLVHFAASVMAVFLLYVAAMEATPVRHAVRRDTLPRRRVPPVGSRRPPVAAPEDAPHPERQ